MAAKSTATSSEETKKPRRTRKKAESPALYEETGATLGAEESSSVTSALSSEESEKPKKKTTRRKAAPKPETDDFFDDSLLDGSPAQAAATESSAEPARKPRRRKAATPAASAEENMVEQIQEKQIQEQPAPQERPVEPEPIRETYREEAPASRYEAPADNEAAGEPAVTADSDAGEGETGDAGDRRRGRNRRRRGGKNRRDRQKNNTGKPNGGPASQSAPAQPEKQQKPRQKAPVEEITGPLDGVLELHPKGYGFIREPSRNYMAQDSDAFVSSSLIEKYALRPGLMIHGFVGPGIKNQGPRLKAIESVDGMPVDEYKNVRKFDEMTPINPFEQIKLETGPTPVTMRVMDLLTPIGKGQRALIVAPPRTGKTMLLQDIADAVSTNHPEIHLIVLLIDERPEEVTEIRRKVNGEVIASSMDRELENHIRISQLIFERAKRLTEMGRDVFVMLDSITRTARAFNKWVKNSGRIQTGGLDVKAMDVPKKMFGTARRFEEGGSLTVVGTALIDTGSHMDQAIFQEFKGTGNMELVLSRSLADRRIWPSMDIEQSGTRREEKILDPAALEGVTMLRRSLISMSPVEAMEQLTATLRKFPTNEEFLKRIKQVL